MSTLTNPRLPKGSTIFITGGTGYIGAWVAHEVLCLGYKVRSAVRSLENSAWLQAHFDSLFPSGQYTQIHLPSLSDQAAISTAIHGCAGIFHIALNTTLSLDPAPYIPQAVAETLAVLKAAASEPSVKAVVLTSSSMAAVAPGAKPPGPIPAWAYNEEYISLAWDPAFTHPAKYFFVYGAAKAQAEKAAWQFVKDENPHYVLNTILPNANFGPSLVYTHQGHPSTASWAKALFDGDVDTIANIPPQYFIDVRDTAKLHLAALLDADTAGERLWGFAERFNWNDVLALFRKVWPERQFPKDLEGLGVDESIADTEGALGALRRVYGLEGWRGLEGAVRDAGFDREKVEV
ncbi:NAD(P)-binding protein [Ophiobolus disseminans]|uniref:NAD(P)-binding protein n=1 Tax=Ophiobolus disseminans TaxID=1469910 RepID=A0A6A7A7J4_9PLEO|nr:NAD(P)-binding protein [Ophiobolus disseminans]